MLKRVLLVLLALFIFGVGVVIAQEDDSGLMWVDTGEDNYGLVRAFRDGRLNAFDMGAPVAVYYTHHEVRPASGPTMAVTDGIDLLAIEPVTNNGRLVLHATVQEIRDRIAEMGGEDCLVLESNGYSLHYAEPGWFWVATPPDREGKVYSFVWPDTVIHPEP